MTRNAPRGRILASFFGRGRISQKRPLRLAPGILMLALLVPVQAVSAASTPEMISFDQPTGNALGELWFPSVRDLDVPPACSWTFPIECPGGVPRGPGANLRITRQSLAVVLYAPNGFDFTANVFIDTLDPLAINVFGVDCTLTIDSSAGSSPTVGVFADANLMTDGTGLLPYNFLEPGSVAVFNLDVEDFTISGGNLCAILGSNVPLGFVQDVLEEQFVDVIQADAELCAAPAPTVLATCPWLEVAPSTVSFSDQPVGSTSTQQTITITNAGPPPPFAVQFGQITIEGADASDFSLSADGCSDAFLYHGPCELEVTFSPSAAGPRSAHLVVPSSWVTSPDSVALTGSGVASDGSFNIASATSTGTTSMTVTFDAQPDAVQASTLANYSVPGLTLAGSPTLSGNTVTIATSAQAAQTYTVTVSNVTRGSDAMPLTTNSATFAGTSSSAPPQVDVSPASLAFGSVPVGSPSASQQVTVTNTAAAGAASLHIAPLAVQGTSAPDYGLANDLCSNASLAPGASCTVSVTFLPSARGLRTASLQVPDDATGSPQSVPLSGTGVAPVASISPTSIDFGTVDVGTPSPIQAITITNTGDPGQFLAFSSAQITGANAADFSMVSEACVAAGTLVAPGASCTIEVTFTPSAAGARSASLSITDNADDSPQTVALTGVGGAPTADLAVGISAALGGAKAKGRITYTITIYNAGPSTALDLLLNDTLSSQTTFVSVSTNRGSCVAPLPGATGVIACRLGSLASGASAPVQIVVTVIARKGSVTNTVMVSTPTFDPNLVNNVASITTQVK